MSQTGVDDWIPRRGSVFSHGTDPPFLVLGRSCQELPMGFERRYHNGIKHWRSSVKISKYNWGPDDVYAP